MVVRQAAAMNTVLLHARSSEAAHSAASKARRWKRRKAEETKKGAKRERTTFYAAQYDLDEPLLKQFLMFMAAECAEKKSTDFVEVSESRFVPAIIASRANC